MLTWIAPTVVFLVCAGLASMIAGVAAERGRGQWQWGLGALALSMAVGALGAWAIERGDAQPLALVAALGAPVLAPIALWWLMPAGSGGTGAAGYLEEQGSAEPRSASRPVGRLDWRHLEIVFTCAGEEQVIRPDSIRADGACVVIAQGERAWRFYPSGVSDAAARNWAARFANHAVLPEARALP